MPVFRFASMLLLAAISFAAETIPGAAGGLVVHEWGTFTSVASGDGTSIPWTVFADDGDLPCFVVRPFVLRKSTAHARVRMETPVLYFYTPRPATVSVRVEFPQGGITEWYPPAVQTGPRLLDWERVDLLPGNEDAFPSTKARSHYFAARETDAAPVRVGDRGEKFLFYRGIGEFEVPVQPRVMADGAVVVREPVRGLLFENRGGRMGYRAVLGTHIAKPVLTGTVDGLRHELVAMLTDAGLYEKEAQAMFETWRDSWFEEGMRLLYLVPREKVDELLPLDIQPRPQAIERVFVGRVELLSPSMRETIGTALAQRDKATLLRYGRFLNAFAREIANPFDQRIAQFLDGLYNEAGARLNEQPGCVH
jgi:hypothetical protein